jgi:pSer/pThr/pTyr-binding forkhead associated (FHA) protein
VALRSPELVFISGPQQGLHTKITADPAVVGRVASCDIVLSEDFASRQQMRFENSPDGWLMENLSSNGTRVNGKKYKGGKKILLATGDCLGVGLTTEILYVAPGDDSESALSAYRQSHPLAETSQTDTAGTSALGDKNSKVKTSILPAILGTVAAKDKDAKDEAQAYAVPIDAEEAKKKAKQRKYIMGFGIYLVILLGLAITYKFVHNPADSEAAGLPMLSRNDIESALLARPPADHRPMDAEQERSTARNLFPNRAANIGDTYKVVRNYNAYLAHKDGGAVFEESVDDGNFSKASAELVDAVINQYNAAYAYEKNHDWVRAGKAFSNLLKMIPVDPSSGGNDPVNSRLRQNIYDHLYNINQQKKAT